MYERLINCTNDPGVKEALGFLMTREIAHQQSFEKALYSIQPNFPVGKLPGMPEFSNVYFNMSSGDGDLRGPWNNEPTFEYREGAPAVDGGNGLATVDVDEKSLELVNRAAMRLQSDPKSDPVTNGKAAAASSPLGARIQAKSQKSPPSRRS